eukprot:PhM_4_TR13541/c0_g1_i1/m.7882
MGRGISARRTKTPQAAKRQRSLSRLKQRIEEGVPLQDIDDADIHSVVSEAEDDSIVQPEVLTKYKTAGKFCNAALQALIDLCVAGTSVHQMCKTGDSMLREKLETVYTRATNEEGKPMQKGLAYPTNVSVNKYVANYTSMHEDIVLKDGDVVKIHLGCHLDGYPVLAAHTVVVGETCPSKETHAVVRAAYIAASAVARMFHPEEINDDMTNAIQKIAEAYRCEPAAGVLSHRIKRFIIDGQKCVITRRVVDQEPMQDVDDFEINGNQVYNVDIVLCSRDPELRPHGELEPYIYRRNEVMAPLRMKAARHTLMEVRKKFLSFPFMVDEVFEGDVPRSKFGVKALHGAGLADPQPVMISKSQTITARFSCTVAVTESSVHILAGLPALTGAVTMAGEHVAPEINALLTRSLQHNTAAPTKQLATK